MPGLALPALMFGVKRDTLANRTTAGSNIDGAGWSGRADILRIGYFFTDIRVVGKPTEDLYLPPLLHLFPATVLESSFSSISWFYSPVTVLSPSHPFSATLIGSFQF